MAANHLCTCVQSSQSTWPNLYIAAGPLLYPFGDEVDNSVNTTLDDGSSPAFNLSQPFPFYGTNHDVIYVSQVDIIIILLFGTVTPSPVNNNDSCSFLAQVNTNGVVSFGRPFTSAGPSLFPLDSALVAVFWDDVNTRDGGIIFYRETDDSRLLKRFSDEIQNVTEDRRFVPTTLFIATWFRVAPYTKPPSTTKV